MRWRRMIAVLTLAAIAVVAAALLGRGSTSTTTAKASKGLARIANLEGGLEEAGGATAEAYSDRAFPASEISSEQVEGAVAANQAVNARGAKLGSKWDSLGPSTLNVDRLGTQGFTAPTQWSGRVTALTVRPKCKPQECTLYVGAAGGGVWRSKNALAPNPAWKFISDGIPTNAIGSITVDPNDATGKTIYVGTGEANASGDSEAGVGLYRTTDDGAHWSLVPGAKAISNLRAIGGTAIEPGDPSHIAIATRPGQRGIGSNQTGTGTVAAQSPATGIWETHDGGANWALTRPGIAYEVRFDPGNPNVLFASIGSVGITRSTNDGAWEAIFSRPSSGRFTFSPVVKSGKTRIYLADATGTGSPSGAQVYRVDDASQPALTMTASNNAAWTRLSNPAAGTPGNAVYNYCNTPLSGSQCFYDMYIASPADHPDEVVVSGLMHYEELKPYAARGGMRSNGRSVMMSTDAGINWKDMTGDPQGESMHPDQHAVVFVPGNPNQFFAGSDGGVIRTNGKFVDGSSMCNGRGLSAAFLADCQAWLSRIPAKLEPVNAGLGTLQMNSVGVSPFLPDTASTGTQDNGTLSFSGSSTWLLPLTGDGGDSGFDATEPKTRFHTYTGGQMDINYDGDNPKTWLFIGDAFGDGTVEAQRFYAPVIADPLVSHTIFVGAQRVWRTQDLGGDRTFLEQHCNTAAGEFGTSDLLFTGACGSAAHWKAMSAPLTGAAFGAGKVGGTLTSVSRGRDAGTMWVASQGGRVFVTQDANAPIGSITFTRIDTTAQPNRVPSSVFVDPTNANHAIVTFSGYEANTPTLLGHVFDVVYDPATHSAAWTNISSDIGDQPVNDAVLDTATGDLYISTDFGVYRRVSGETGWIPAADGVPMAAVSGLTIANGKNGDRLIYAATHGRGAYRLRLK